MITNYNDESYVAVRWQKFLLKFTKLEKTYKIANAILIMSYQISRVVYHSRTIK